MKRYFALVFLVCALLVSSGCGKREVPEPILGQEVEATGTFDDILGSHTYTLELRSIERMLYRDINDTTLEETGETCDCICVEIHVDNDKEYWEKSFQLLDIYMEKHRKESDSMELSKELEAEYLAELHEVQVNHHLCKVFFWQN